MKNKKKSSNRASIVAIIIAVTGLLNSCALNADAVVKLTDNVIVIMKRLT